MQKLEIRIEVFVRDETLDLLYMSTSLMIFVINKFKKKSAVHGINIKNKYHLHRQVPNFHVFQEVCSMLSLIYSKFYHIRLTESDKTKDKI